jgi:hypothetical protein
MLRGPRLASLALVLPALAAASSSPPITVELRDYATLPITGTMDGTGQTDGMLARVNSLREEPGGANRFFVNDLNGPLYILDKKTKTFTTYLDFNGRAGHSGIFHKLSYETGYANGLVSVQFDPDYRRNGRFYTIHIEDPAVEGTAGPDNAHIPAFEVRGYDTTVAVNTPGDIQREAVLIEWTDTNTSNATFEGPRGSCCACGSTPGSIPLRYGVQPSGAPGRAGMGCSLYRQRRQRLRRISNGDPHQPSTARYARRQGSANHSRSRTAHGVERGEPERPLPHSQRQPVCLNARRARRNLACGFRNPHRLHWAIDAANPSNNRLVADSIGLHTWETVNIVHKGANYGYSRREGNQALQTSNQVGPLPADDSIPILIGDTVTKGTITPTYPVLQYGHVPGGGDAIGSGFLYAGKAIPMLRGKYVFTDISTGHIWFADYKEMLAADDGDPRTMAERHEIKISWEKQNYDTMFPIAQAAYHARGGKNRILPGRALVSGEGRADANLAVDAAGELYVFTKTDGMIRALISGR